MYRILTACPSRKTQEEEKIYVLNRIERKKSQITKTNCCSFWNADEYLAC